MLVAVVTVVLSFVLPGPENTAEAAAALVSSANPYSENGITQTPPPSATKNEQAETEAPQNPQPTASPIGSYTDPLPESDLSVVQQFSPEAEPIPTTTPDAAPIPTTAPDIPDLVPGCSDPRIIEVQTRLMDLGYMGHDEPTDHYGYGTEYALQLFQRKHNLQVDGLLGQQTQSMLYSSDAMTYTVKLGDRGTDVKGIQERLQELNYLKSKTSGYFGTDTENAVKGFQKRNGLASDGNVGDNTFEVLYSEDAKAAKTPTISSGGSGNSGGSGSGSGGSDSSGGSGSGSGGSDSSGGSGSESESGNTSPPPKDPDDASASALIEFAKTQLGVKYVRGGKSSNGFDCSGFVYYCLNQVGYKIKYMTSAGWGKSSLPKISKMSDLKKGDIVCFKGHVGIYLGSGQMIDASSSAGKIRICSNIFTSTYWKKTFICGRRVF